MSPGIRATLKAHWISIAIAVAAFVVALEFLGVVLRHTRFGLPIEDAYIYLTYAKQFGRAEPFTYFSGGGYSAGSTSVIWPMILAPFWTLGARGGALVWVSFFMCAALYAVTGVACSLLVRRMFGALPGVLAACLALAIAPFAFTALSGMEVALASALLVAAIYQLHAASETGPPSRKLGVTLACLALSRPEATLIVAFVVVVHAARRLRHREWRAAVWWAAPMLAPLLWVVANRTLAGHWFPNTGVAKSHFYLPGFDWTYWWAAVTSQTKAMLLGLFWKPTSPFVWPRLVALLWLVGAVRVLVWAYRARQLLVGVLIVLAPLGLILAVIASSGAWTFHNYRYISPAFPLIMVAAACALAPFRLLERSRWLQRGWNALAVCLLLLFIRAAYTPMRADMALYAQNATDLNAQVVRIGHYIHDHLPDARIMFHDAGAVAYYGDRPVYDMLGLVTNHQANVANNGPGSRFEFLESLPPEDRPTHFAYYPGWMGQGEFFGDVVLRTPLGPPFHSRRLIGDYDMQLIVASWDHVHTAERPLEVQPGWNIVDRIDVADVASEAAHGWHGGMGRRRFGDPTARWSVFHKDQQPALLLDGGRTIRAGSERFRTHVDPAKPVRIVMRTGGKIAYPFHEAITAPVELVLRDANGVELGRATLPPPSGTFAEVTFEFRTSNRALEIVTQAARPYRVFHWFVLQPD
ncbi:MAG TPA: hypothetical protein VFS15_08800 [Kofleriaceae bacterium]|nr:hypothetical protein [Kofleriaceae bacterium]